MKRKKSNKPAKKVESFSHPEAKRKNIPTVQHQPFMSDEQQNPIEVKFKRPNAELPPAMKKAVAERDEDFDPQLVWKGKSGANAHELTVKAPPLYIQEKVHPKTMIDDLMRYSNPQARDPEPHPDLFGDDNGVPKGKRADYYQHQGNWQNRMILGDSLQIMASLIEKEGLAGQAQVFYFDPPYGIKFNSNFQWTTTSRAVKDGDGNQIPREPETVKAFRDTWRHGIHSYLNYIRDRLTLARELLHKSGSIFLQIGDENVHLMRSLMDELFGKKNSVALITFTKATAQSSKLLSNASDYLLWYAKDKKEVKYRTALHEKVLGQPGTSGYTLLESVDGTRHRQFTPEEKRMPYNLPPNQRVFTLDHMRGTRHPNPTDLKEYEFQGFLYNKGGRHCWKTNRNGMDRLARAGRLMKQGNQLSYKRYFDDFLAYPMVANWTDTSGATGQVYIVQTSPKVIQRCVLMASDPGDLVIDPTCGSGTTAYVSEQWGRRWIVMDTSRVALALTRARMMAAKFPYYLLYDSPAGQAKEAQLNNPTPK